MQHQQLRQQNIDAMNQTPVLNNSTKVEKKPKAKKELNKQSSSESITTKSSTKDEPSTKCNGTTTQSSSAITATQKRKDKKLKTQLAKQSSVEDNSSVESVVRGVKPKVKETIPVMCNKAKRNSVDVEPQIKLTKESQAESDVKKEERRKVKAPKYEYADPQYKTNKFDVLDMDDDDDYYISEEESINSGVTTSTGDNQLPSNVKKISAKAIVSNKKPKQPTPTPPPQQPVIVKAEKPKPVKELPSQLAKEKSPVEVEVHLSKKQKKKLAQQQTRQQNQGAFKSTVPKSGDSLSNAMHKLRLNDDTTIELVKESHGAAGCNAVRQQIFYLAKTMRLHRTFLFPGKF